MMRMVMREDVESGEGLLNDRGGVRRGAKILRRAKTLILVDPATRLYKSLLCSGDTWVCVARSDLSGHLDHSNPIPQASARARPESLGSSA